ncbi:hypothetical protein DYH55_04790 [Methylovirgula sp. 4M-Z18]|nr:hypothetical protein DYH55_04790 [Methylovirgula sp. 4M-Z18]
MPDAARLTAYVEHFEAKWTSGRLETPGHSGRDLSLLTIQMIARALIGAESCYNGIYALGN